MTRKTLNLMGCLVLLTASAAFAEDEGELVEKVAVRNRIFSVEGRWEVGGNVGFSLLPRLTDHYNLNLSGAYNIKDWFALELRAGYAISRHTSLADQIQTDFFANSSISKANDAADLWEMTVNAVIGARFQPIYGKINLMADLPVHFQLYAWVGGGVGLLKRESLVMCASKASARECREFVTSVDPADSGSGTLRASPLVSLALGFRFFVVAGHAIKLEARSWSWLDQYYVDIDRTAASDGNPAAGGKLSPNAGITNLVQIDLGYSFTF
ncbi:MAG: outer membrane beta-barrel domain-containing protein [Myxococcota bacterium]